MKVYILMKYYSHYDGGPEMIGVYENRNRAVDAYMDLNTQVSTPILPEGKTPDLFDDCFYIEEWDVE